MHGGKRSGAGRRKGEATKKTREVADRAALEGITPLEVMIEAMRDHYDKREMAAAAAIAKDAAPYMHARFSSVQVSGSQSDPLQIVITEILVTNRADANRILTALPQANGVP